MLTTSASNLLLYFVLRTQYRGYLLQSHRYKRDNWCYLRGTNTLAGGCSKYNYLVNQFKKATNCSFPELVRATSAYNEICFGLRKTISESMINKPANFVLVDKDINILTTIINGKIVYERK